MNRRDALQPTTAAGAVLSLSPLARGATAGEEG